MATEGVISVSDGAVGMETTGDLHVGITFKREELIDSLAERIYDHMRHSRNSDFDSLETTVRERVDAMVKERLKEVAQELTEDAVRAQVGVLLAEGWEVTEGYGATTKRITVRGLVINWLAGKLGENEGGYNDRGKSRLDVIARDLVTAAMKTDLEKEIEGLKAQVRGMLKANVDKGIREVFMGALGLKVD